LNRTTRPREKILIVDDQAPLRAYVRRVLEELGHPVLEAAGRDDALRIFESEADALFLVLLDLDFAGEKTGFEILRRMKTIRERVPVMLLTGEGSAADGAEAIRLGAADVLEKDTYIEQNLGTSVEKVRRLSVLLEELRALGAENSNLRQKVDLYEAAFRERYHVVGESAAFIQVIEEARRIARVPRPVLIRGDRGTGKELIAAYIHYHSDRAERPFVTVNCAAFHGNLLESELFGHEKGAFTGADRRKIGRFEQAHGGTLFLDEIGNMAKDFQEKVLRVLEYQRFERVAGTETVETDVRVVAATNADLEAMMKEGRFRPDLYDRLSFKELRLPTLAERHGDVPLLVEHFRRRIAAEVPWVAPRRFTEAALVVLGRHPWPGNVRQLKNVVERLLCAGDDPSIDAPEVARELDDPQKSAGGFKERIEALERQLVLDALMRTGGNQRAAADDLELTYDQIRHLYKKHRLKELLADEGS
jgi:DNA-binding NtrC family response regulator